MWWKSKRRLELERKELELYYLKHSINEMLWWCSADSSEIGHAMLELRGQDGRISCIFPLTFREKLRRGELTYTNLRRN